MVEENRPLVDLNEAEKESLTNLPNVGPEIAQRIIAARPFRSAEDLRRVSGIGSASLERLRPHITVSDSSETDMETWETATRPDDETESADLALGFAPEPEVPKDAQTEAAGIRPEEEVSAVKVEPQSVAEGSVPLEEPAPRQERRWVSRTRAFWIALGISALVSIVTLLLSLGIVANLNGGSLQFVTPSQLNVLAREVDALDAQMMALDQDVKGLRTRLDNLEALSTNVTAIEDAVKQLQEGMDASNAQIETLQQEIDGFDSQIEAFQNQRDALQTQMDELEAQNARFEDLMVGLRDLLNTVLGSEESR